MDMTRWKWVRVKPRSVMACSRILRVPEPCSRIISVSLKISVKGTFFPAKRWFLAQTPIKFSFLNSLYLYFILSKIPSTATKSSRESSSICRSVSVLSMIKLILWLSFDKNLRSSGISTNSPMVFVAPIFKNKPSFAENSWRMACSSAIMLSMWRLKISAFFVFDSVLPLYSNSLIP